MNIYGTKVSIKFKKVREKAGFFDIKRTQRFLRSSPMLDGIWLKASTDLMASISKPARRFGERFRAMNWERSYRQFCKSEKA